MPSDQVIPLHTPECCQCKSCLSAKTNLCKANRAAQRKGLMPDNKTRLIYKSLDKANQVFDMMHFSEIF